MPVTSHEVAGSDLLVEEVGRWREVPAAIAADLGPEVGRIDPAIRLLHGSDRRTRVFGRAVTARCEPPDFGPVPHAVDRCGPGDVLVIAAGGDGATAMIGDILGGQLRRRGGVGIVCDGAVRDTAVIGGWGDFAVFARSVTPRGPSSAERGAIGAEVVIGGCVVRPGDLVIGDADGLVVLGPDAVRGLIGAAEAKLAKEAAWEADLVAGRSVAEVLGVADRLLRRPG